jgi:hypothetical protein
MDAGFQVIQDVEVRRRELDVLYNGISSPLLYSSYKSLSPFPFPLGFSCYTQLVGVRKYLS